VDIRTPSWVDDSPAEVYSPVPWMNLIAVEHPIDLDLGRDQSRVETESLLIQGTKIILCQGRCRSRKMRGGKAIAGKRASKDLAETSFLQLTLFVISTNRVISLV